jgi:hypothetical protein
MILSSCIFESFCELGYTHFKRIIKADTVYYKHDFCKWQAGEWVDDCVFYCCYQMIQPAFDALELKPLHYNLNSMKEYVMF